MYAELFDRSLDKRIDFTEFILIPETEIYFDFLNLISQNFLRKWSLQRYADLRF